jgi:hypothetical protein
LEKFYGRSCGLKKKPKVKHDREMGRRRDLVGVYFTT